MAANLCPPSFSLSGSNKTPICSFQATSQSHGDRGFPGGCPTAQTTQAGRWVLHRTRVWCHPNVQGMMSPNPRCRCRPVTRPDAVRPEKLDHVVGEPRAEPSPQDHHVPGQPRMPAEDRRPAEEIEQIGRYPDVDRACPQSRTQWRDTTQAVPGMGGLIKCLVPFQCQTAPNPAASPKQAGMGTLP